VVWCLAIAVVFVPLAVFATLALLRFGLGSAGFSSRPADPGAQHPRARPRDLTRLA
jgi:hypothetical protein